VRGTLIRTARGDVAIEALTIGDLLVTASGERKPVRWIGHRRLDCSRYPEPSSVWPVCVVAGAFGEQTPARDLWLSPEHCVAAEGVFIPIRHLINGKTVVQRERASVEYWHVQLDDREVILAEGLPAESYGGVHRAFFANGGTVVEAYPDFRPVTTMRSALARVSAGTEIARTKTLLLERLEAFGYAITTDPGLHLLVDGNRVEPIQLGTMRFAFAVPAGRSEVRLRSRTFVPAHTMPESSDERLLGIAVKRLQLDGEDVALDDAAFFGADWTRLDGTPDITHRWTTGDARLPSNVRLVVLDLCVAGRYLLDPHDHALALFA
jgi:hypothetical protein